MGLEVHILDAETGKVRSICLEKDNVKICYGDASVISKAIHILAMSIAHAPFITDTGEEGHNGA